MAVSSVPSVRAAWSHIERRAPGAVVDALRAVRQADVLVFAGSLAFYALVSAVPLGVLSFWLVGTALGRDEVDRLVDFLVRSAPAGESLMPLFEGLLRTGADVGAGAVVAVLWPATSYGSGLGRAFARMAGADEPAPGLRGRLRGLVIVVLLPVYLLGALGVAYLAPGLFGEGALATAAGWLLAAGAATTGTGLFLVAVYSLYGPDRVSWRSTVLASVVGAVATMVISLVFMAYFAHGADWRQRAAGSGVGTAVLFGLWLYLANAILLAGYCLAHLLDRNGSRSPGRRRR